MCGKEGENIFPSVFCLRLGWKISMNEWGRRILRGKGLVVGFGQVGGASSPVILMHRPSRPSNIWPQVEKNTQNNRLGAIDLKG